MCWVRFTFPMSGFCYITLSFLITRLSCPVNLEMESLVFGLFCPRVVHFVQPEDPMLSFFEKDTWHTMLRHITFSAYSSLGIKCGSLLISAW